MLQIRRRAGAVAALAIMVAVASATAGAIAASGRSVRQTSGTAFLAATPRSSKGLVYYAGFNSDKVLGQGATTYTIKPTTARSGTITATAKKVTLWTRTGTLSGVGTATLHITNQPHSGDDKVTGGKIRLIHGTGGQAGHSIVATFTGAGNIVTGQYVFHYKGTYK